jgi:hypothetical protein
LALQSFSTSATARPAAKSVKLTVGNVTKSSLLLYTVGDDGKLAFFRELPHGEAFDQTVPAGQRWIALFADKRAGEAFAVPQADATWLLRPEDKAARSGK